MVSKDCFVKTINEVKRLGNVQNDVYNVYRKNDIDFCNTGVECNYEDLIINLLKEDMHDINDWIAWWVWEMNYGSRVEEDSASYSDGTPINVKTPELLYDFLHSEYKERLNNGEA